MWSIEGDKVTLREKCPNTEFFLSVLSCIGTESRKIRTRKNSVFGHFSRSVSFSKINPTGNYLFKVNSKYTRTTPLAFDGIEKKQWHEIG